MNALGLPPLKREGHYASLEDDAMSLISSKMVQSARKMFATYGVRVSDEKQAALCIAIYLAMKAEESE